ncbi:hypothetical protein I3271_07090 [Photobacterium leiognathi]|uniref:hypothetical protein n=1 Tax=Photobacterium leiognathi TaxID=553611 RepID=UPI001EDD4992|nr:hypothetical protein [Photobacterium leiognathi]MCG3884451.1 hypothetical protein [Photobacterium leiognathi]
MPTVVVESGSSHSSGGCAVCCDPRIPSLYNEIITMYNLLASPQLKTLDNSTSSSHMVKYNHWPNGVHYGFYLNQPLNLISIELRVTDINLAPVLSTLKKYLSSDIGGQPVELLPESDHVIGGLCLVLSLEGLEVVADAVGAMIGLITLTNKTVSNAVDRK